MTNGFVAGTIIIKVNDADQTSIVTIPIMLPSNSVALKGSYIRTIEIDYEIVDAPLTSVTAAVNKVTRGADGADAVVAAQTFTYDSGHDTAEERVEQDTHKMVLTLDTPIWIDNDEYLLVALTCDQAGDNGVIQFFSATANYTERL